MDLQYTKCAASQVYQGTKAVARECTKAVIGVHNAVQQMRIDTNVALKQVANHVQSIINATNDHAEGVLAMRSELQ